LPSNDVSILVGYSLPAVVIGAMMTVRMFLVLRNRLRHPNCEPTFQGIGAGVVRLWTGNV